MLKKLFLILILSFLSIVLTLKAGTQGKLLGTIVDKNSGELLAGANIYLEGTNLGAASDEEGKFIIINITPGIYNIIIEYVGYTSQKHSEVRIASNLSTILEIELTASAIESDETITIIAERPLIRHDVTSKLAIVDGDEIVSMPVDNFNDVVASQAGITTDAEGKLHFRGGRTNEVTFLIDGQVVENPVNREFGSIIDNYAIRELQVLSGTFNAEYGRAMSGIINIVTNEGTNKFSTKVEYTSPMLISSPYRKKNALVQDKNPIYDKEQGSRLFYKETDGLDIVNPEYPYEGNFTGFLSGPLPAGLGSVFLSGEYDNENSWLPFGYTFNRSLFAKITFPLSINKLSFIIQYSDRNSQPYNHRYKYLPQNQGHWEIISNRYAMQYNHVFSSNSYLILNTSFLDHRSLFIVGNLTNEKYIFPELDENLEFVIAGNNKIFSDFNSTTLNSKVDWVYQYGQYHEFKSGFELNQYELDIFDFSNEEVSEELYFLNDNKVKPISASIYIQDKIEYSSIIINAGLRADYVDVKAEAYNNIEEPSSGLKKTDPELKLSPRLGLAYPISENTVLHFSYGHFLQFPNFEDIYKNLQFLNPDILKVASLALVPNPAVKSQKTISYEFGISQKIGNNYALKVAVHSKDITDLLGTIFVETTSRYAVFINNDFARIQGIDISLEKRIRNYWGVKLDYTYSVARGNEATATEEAYNIFEGRKRSIKEFFLDFDRRHDFSVNLSLFLPDNYGPQVFGFYPLEQLNFSMLADFSSGLPYTPISDDRTQYFEKNSARMPWTKTVDIRLEKKFPLTLFQLSFFVEATNIFDWLNPLVVQPRSGKVWDDGKSTLFGSGRDYMHDPLDVGPPRIIKIGASVAL
jgi:outer membrane receptor protein involved in Fe transport